MNPYNDSDYYIPTRGPKTAPWKSVQIPEKPRPKPITKNDLRQATQDKINRAVDKHVLTINTGLKTHLKGAVFFIHTNDYREEILSELVRIYTAAGWKIVREKKYDKQDQQDYDQLTLT